MSTWDSTTVLRKRPEDKARVAKSQTDLNAARRSGAAISTEKKSTLTNASHANTDHRRIAKLDRDNEVAPPPKVDVSVGKAIQKGRQDKGLTQKDLAQKINEKPQVVSRFYIIIIIIINWTKKRKENILLGYLKKEKSSRLYNNRFY
ncbi:unnamed protein product [Cunninghamella blakesleeana]